MLELIIRMLTNRLDLGALHKRVLQSVDFTVNRVLMKLSESSNTSVIEQYISFKSSYHLYSSRNVLRNF